MDLVIFAMLCSLHPLRFLKKFKSDKDPKFIERLPEFKPGDLGTCAIIGNADNLLKHKWGPEIDQHDFVVRFNVKMKVHLPRRALCALAIVVDSNVRYRSAQGFEPHVGTKTGGLWTKPHYVDRKEDGDQKPSRFGLFLHAYNTHTHTHTHLSLIHI